MQIQMLAAILWKLPANRISLLTLYDSTKTFSASDFNCLYFFV